MFAICIVILLTSLLIVLDANFLVALSEGFNIRSFVGLVVRCCTRLIVKLIAALLVRFFRIICWIAQHNVRCVASRITQNIIFWDTMLSLNYLQDC